MINQIGRLDSRITLERGTASRDTQGSVTDAWAGLATVWAHAEALKEDETTANSERGANQDYQFTIRYQTALADLSATDRIVWRGTNYDILSAVPMPEGRPDSIILTARSKA